MRYKNPLIVAAFLVCGATSYAKFTAPAAAPAAIETQPAVPEIKAEDKARFAKAVRLYRAGQYSAAYGRFTMLADGGHKYAAVISLQMLRNGPYFYRTEWTATQAQVDRWQRTAGVTVPYEVAVAAGE
jgi:hypothetical protein